MRLVDDNDGSAERDDPCPCEGDPIAVLRDLFVDFTMGRRIQAGQSPVARPVFLKSHGIAHGTFRVERGLDKSLGRWVFAHDEFRCWVRFSSDTQTTLPDLGSTLGVAIKLFDVPGSKVLGASERTHDFILQNHDVFFVDDAKAMCEFTWAGLKTKGGYDAYLAKHPEVAAILAAMNKTVPSVVRTPYWSVIAFKLGEDGPPVKYKLAPLDEDGLRTTSPAEPDANYLRVDLRRRLLAGPARFGFYVQKGIDQASTPIDRATARWDEARSAPQLVATLTLDIQDIEARTQEAYGENLSFNIWRALPENQPLGSIAEARKSIYAAAADVRRDLNGIPAGEPERARALASSATPRDTTVVSAKIHPAIGVARVGNSADPDGYFYGPEVVDPPQPSARGTYRDKTGAIKRQAARFRVYGYNAANEVVGELTLDSADIQWTAHLANKKAAWYQFQIALDVPEAAQGPESLLRNKAVPAAGRGGLAIDPGPRSIRGRKASGARYAFDSGAFLGQPIYLGELRTDDAGRVVVLGGRGAAGAPKGEKLTDFANNDGWYDDIADGPVTAQVSIAGRSIPVDPAWVIVAPPNYAPPLKGFRTLHDLLVDVFVRATWLPAPMHPSFVRDVYPLLARLEALGWVNKGYADGFGPGTPTDWLRPETLERLASAAPENAETRRTVLNAFRPVEGGDPSPRALPWIYGDAMAIEPVSARQHIALTPTQYLALRRWADGDFDEDLAKLAPSPPTIEEVPLADRPAMLDRAALDFCLADAFHPGCEVTWPIRHVTLFSAPFRIRHRDGGDVEPDYGKKLQAEHVLREGGALAGQVPGGLTRWMAVPWHADTSSCLSGYDKDYDPYLPTFWPAHVPNQVLREEEYARAVDPTLPRDQRRAAFRSRHEWIEVIGDDYYTRRDRMVSEFWKLGIVEYAPGVTDDPLLPKTMLVEQMPPAAAAAPVARVAVHLAGTPGQKRREDISDVDRVRRFRRK